MILAIARSRFAALPEAGCWPLLDLEVLAPLQWYPREWAESDETLLQPIVYLVLQDAADGLWCYRRCGGDARLDGRYSCGVGGHIDAADFAGSPAATVQNALRRELEEELTAGAGIELPDAPLAWIYEGLSAVGRVHVGMLYVARWTSAATVQVVQGEKLESIGFQSMQAVIDDHRFELWSRLAAAFLQRSGR